MAKRAIASCLAAAILLGAGPALTQSDITGAARGLLDRLGGGQGGTQQTGDIAAGLKEALRVGVERVVGKVGAIDGFNRDPAIHIPLPPNCRRCRAGCARSAWRAWLTTLKAA